MMWVYGFSQTAAIAFLVLKTSGKRIVIDNSSPKDPYVSLYCQLSHLCPSRGSHILCLTKPYGYGPACHNVSESAVMRPDLAFRILAIFNGMRSKIAMGTEVWRSFDSDLDLPFPRGYGIWKLEWDSELATFAQIWANQCLDQIEEFSYDFCHASTRFPFATQIVGDFSKKNVAVEDIAPVIISLISNIYRQAKTSDSIDVRVLKWCLKKCGDRTAWSYKYLQIINGANTHVGCGVSVSKNMNGQRFRVILVCNFSHQTRHFSPLYQLEFPKSKNDSLLYTQCGCPPNAYETPDCLCKAKKSRCTGSKCSPSVLVLPVVAFEEKAVTLE